MKDWQRRKRAGLPTRTTPILTEEERILRKHNSSLNAGRKATLTRRNKLREVFGDKCCICGNTIHLTIHEVNGKPHKRIWSISNAEFEKVLADKANFAQVCWLCHKHVHWVMKYLKLTWNNIRSVVF